MDKILVDTNIVLDLFSKREEFYKEAPLLFIDRAKALANCC